MHISCRPMIPVPDEKKLFLVIAVCLRVCHMIRNRLVDDETTIEAIASLKLGV